MNFITEDNISFVQNDIGHNPENMAFLRNTLTKTQAQCDEQVEGEIKSALGIVDLAISKLGTTQDVPTLTASDESSSDNSDDTSSSEEETRGAKSKHGKDKKMQKRKNRRKQGDSSAEVFKLLLEEQKKANEEQKKAHENMRDEMRKMSSNMRVEVEDIGRGNITAQQQLSVPGFGLAGLASSPWRRGGRHGQCPAASKQPRRGLLLSAPSR